MEPPYGLIIPTYALREFPDPVKGPKVTDIPATVVALFQRYFPDMDENKEEQTVACPFHADDTPSMIINLPHAFYKCYACGLQGSALDFFRRQEGIPWQDAKRALRHLDTQQGSLVSLAEDYLLGRVRPLYLDGPNLICRKIEGDKGGLSGHHGGLCEIPLNGWPRMEPYLAYLLDGAPATVISEVIGDEVAIPQMEKVVKEAVLQLMRGVPAVTGLNRIGPGLHVHKWGPDCTGDVLMVDGRDLYRWEPQSEDASPLAYDPEAVDTLLTPPPEKGTNISNSNWKAVVEIPYHDLWVPIGAPDQVWFPWGYPDYRQRKTPKEAFTQLFRMLASGWVWTDPLDPILCALYTLYCPIFSAWDSPPIQMHISGPSQCLDKNTHIAYTARHMSGKEVYHKGGTLECLYERFHTGYLPTGSGKHYGMPSKNYHFTAACMGPDGTIFQNEIVDVIKSGEKDCFLLETTGGRTITASADHKFWTGTAYVALRDLNPGDAVVVRAASSNENSQAQVEAATIKSILPVGPRETYDICMRNPYNNFVADGFVVHNSGKSALAAGWFGGQLSGSVGMVPGALYYTGGSEAGLRQELNYRRQLVILDELLDQDNRHSREVVEAARGLETSHGFRTIRGTKDGRARNYDVKCPIVWASIAAGGLSQDVNRRINIELRRARNPVPPEPWKTITSKWSIPETQAIARMAIEVMLQNLPLLKKKTDDLRDQLRDSPSGGYRMVTRLAPLVAIADLCGQPVDEIFRAVTAKVGSLESALGATEPVEELRVALLHTKMQFNDGLMPVFMTLGHQISMQQPLEAPEYGIFYDPSTDTLGINPGGLLRLLRSTGHVANGNNSVNLGRMLKDLPGYEGQTRIRTREGSYIRVTRVAASRMVNSEVEVGV